MAKHFVKVMETYPLQVYIAGSISDEQTEVVVKHLSGMQRRAAEITGIGFIKKKNIEPRYVTETMGITQGKLCLGFRTNIEPDSNDFQALMVYNGVLGGGVHSKLFQNVREKASLAYYAYSRLEKFKGLMVVSSGIEFRNKEKALDIILKQLDEIKNGAVSEQEMEATIKSMETGIKSLQDSQINIVDFYLSQIVSGTNYNFSDIIEKIKNVTQEDVVRAASYISLDTVYFLTAPEQE